VVVGSGGGAGAGAGAAAAAAAADVALSFYVKQGASNGRL